MNVLFATPEATPFGKTSGLADASSALPREVTALGDRVWVILPLYRSVRESGIALEPIATGAGVPIDGIARPARFLAGRLPGSELPAVFVEHDPYFDRPHLYGDLRGDYPDNAERFAFFSRAVLEYARSSRLDFRVLHCNDWQTALVPVYLDYLHRGDPSLSRAATVLTIHDVDYQGLFGGEHFAATGLPREAFNWRELEFFGRMNVLKGGLVHSSLLTTVSRTYATEIQTPEFGAGLDGVLRERSLDLVGVQSGIDDSVWNPSVDPLIAEHYSADDPSGKAACKRALQKRCGLPLLADVPILALVSRLEDEKGIDLLAAGFEELMRYELQLVLLGTGEERYHKLLLREGKKFRGKASFHVASDATLAHEIAAGADFLLLPSRYEPAGTSQLISLKYGTIPISRLTGGLRDTIVPATAESMAKGTATGFAFEEYTPDAFLRAVHLALETWRDDRRVIARMAATAMRQDWSWRKTARRMIEVYRDACRKAHPDLPVEPLPPSRREAAPVPAAKAVPAAFAESPFEEEAARRERHRRGRRGRREGAAARDHARAAPPHVEGAPPAQREPPPGERLHAPGEPGAAGAEGGRRRRRRRRRRRKGGSGGETGSLHPGSASSTDAR